jgi:hypothetical protein
MAAQNLHDQIHSRALFCVLPPNFALALIATRNCPSSMIFKSFYALCRNCRLTGCCSSVVQPVNGAVTLNMSQCYHSSKHDENQEVQMTEVSYCLLAEYPPFAQHKGAFLTVYVLYSSFNDAVNLSHEKSSNCRMMKE